MVARRAEIACDKDEGEATEVQETPREPDWDKNGGRGLVGATIGRQSIQRPESQR